MLPARPPFFLPAYAASAAESWPALDSFAFSEADFALLFPFTDAELSGGFAFSVLPELPELPVKREVKHEQDWLHARAATPSDVTRAYDSGSDSEAVKAERCATGAAASAKVGTSASSVPPRRRAPRTPRAAAPSAKRQAGVAKNAGNYVKPARTGGQFPWTAPEVAELVAAVKKHRGAPTRKRHNGINWAAIRHDALEGAFPLIGARLRLQTLKGNKTLQRRWYEFEGKADCKKQSRRFR